MVELLKGTHTHTKFSEFASVRERLVSLSLSMLWLVRVQSTNQPTNSQTVWLTDNFQEYSSSAKNAKVDVDGGGGGVDGDGESKRMTNSWLLAGDCDHHNQL